MALFQFDYLLIAEKSVEVICGLFLLLNRFVPLVLAVLAPIVINIFLLHLFVDHSLLLVAFIMLLMYSYLLFLYRENFKGLFAKRP